jgi:membrane associated rhomboid family serine protease
MVMRNLAINLRITVSVIVILWVVYALNLVLPVDLRTFGLRPRDVEGIAGIFISPFLHGTLAHLAANSSVLFVLLLVSFSIGRRMTLRAVLVIAVAGGSMVWIFGEPSTIHIGASGIIFGLFGFLMFLGIFRKEPKTLMISLISFLLYGGALLSLLAPTKGISWSGHFFGFISGILAAWITRNMRRA